MIAILNAAPSGVYKGTQSLLGINLDGELDVSGSSMDIVMKSTGLLEIDMSCSGEAFTLSGSDVKLAGIDTSGNCVHDELAKNEITLKSFTYSDNQFVFTVSKSIL